jgi:para-nitrobenzyl esterase
MIKSILLTATLSMLAAGLGFAQQPAPVSVEGGLVQGTSEDGLTVFRGIPSADNLAGGSCGCGCGCYER